MYSQSVAIICTDDGGFACGGHALFVDKEEFFTGHFRF